MRKTKKRGGANTSGGLLLVFDLDETIVNTKEPMELNPTIIDILLDASKLRGTTIDAICLLTNNSDRDHVAFIDDIIMNITKSIGKYSSDDNMPEKLYFFDYIMTRTHPLRADLRQQTKQFEDIKTIAHKSGISFRSNEDLMSRTFFFDDQPHVLQKQMATWFDGVYRDQYIQIIPGFTGILTKPDVTNYEPIMRALQKNTSGGKRAVSRKSRK